MLRWIVYALLAISAWKSYEAYQARQTPTEINLLRSEPRPRDIDVGGLSTAQPTSFRCDGRAHCSQMTSCEEATFFLRNCPGTKMDGDNDGIPCERQHC